MAEVERLGSVKRFGSRYGRNVRHKLAKIESVLKGKHKCPYCRNMKVKQLSVGIWQCGKCNAKFTGKAYSLKKIAVEEKEAKPKKVKVAEEEVKEEE